MIHARIEIDYFLKLLEDSKSKKDKQKSKKG